MPTLTARLKSRSGGIDADGHRSYTMVYQVESDSLNVEPDIVEDAVGIAYYAPYPTDLAARLKRKTVSQEGSELYFHQVVLEYDTRPSAADAGTVTPGEPGSAPAEAGANAGQTPPNLRPWVLKWGSVQSERPLESDLDGNAVTNSANQKFDPPIMIPVAMTTLSITAFRLQAQSDKIQRFLNKVNSRTFLGYPKYHARCTDYQITSQYEQGAYYWQVDVTITFKEPGSVVGPDSGWNPVRVLDAGTAEYSDPDGSGRKYRSIVDAMGQPVSQPVPLNGDGEKATPAFLADNGPVYLKFRAYKEDDFAQLI